MTLDLMCVPGTFGRLGVELLDAISEHGFDGVRVDVDRGESDAAHVQRREQVRGFLARPRFFVVFLVGGGHIEVTGRYLVAHVKDLCLKLLEEGYYERGYFAIEPGNEPDIAVDHWRKDPQEMGKRFAECYDVVQEYFPNVPTLSPSISNLNKRGLRYLERMVPYLPRGCAVAFHRYPAGPAFDIPHKGFGSRFDESDLLKELADGRDLWNTETGWAEDNGGYVLGEDQVAARMTREAGFWESLGCKAWCAYQLNSAVVNIDDTEDERRLKSYGARTADERRWKPWAKAIRELKQGGDA